MLQRWDVFTFRLQRYIFYIYKIHILQIFYECLTIETSLVCGVCRQGIEPVPSAARSEERATSERQTSEEVACRRVGRSSGGKQPPSAAAALGAGRRDLRPASVGGSPPVVRPLRAVVSLFVALSSPLIPVRARLAASVGIGYAVPPVGRGSARSGL